MNETQIAVRPIIGDVITFTYKGGRSVKGQVIQIDRKGINLVLKTDYIGKYTEWYIGEEKYFNRAEIKGISIVKE